MSKKLTLHPDTRETREEVFNTAAIIEGQPTPESGLPRGKVTFIYYEESEQSPATVSVKFDSLAIYSPQFEKLEKLLKEIRPDIELILTDNGEH